MNTFFLVSALFVGDPSGWYSPGPCDLEARVIELEKSAAKLREENAALKARLSAVETKLNATTATRAANETKAATRPTEPAPTIFYETYPANPSRRCVNGVCRPR